jgi:protein-S-isoprenylcysteine O-methyltransferase Ste14
MRSRVRKFAHVLERCGLALAGAACGVFVGAHVGSSVPWLTTQGFLLLMMLSGAVGFYLGIDTPPVAFHAQEDGSVERRIDAPEFLSAVGTFLATLTAFLSVGIIILHEAPSMVWTALIMAGWVIGVTMQIVAGAIARTRC